MQASLSERETSQRNALLTPKKAARVSILSDEEVVRVSSPSEQQRDVARQLSIVQMKLDTLLEGQQRLDNGMQDMLRAVFDGEEGRKDSLKSIMLSPSSEQKIMLRRSASGVNISTTLIGDDADSSQPFRLLSSELMAKQRSQKDSTISVRSKSNPSGSSSAMKENSAGEKVTLNSLGHNGTSSSATAGALFKEQNSISSRKTKTIGDFRGGMEAYASDQTDRAAPIECYDSTQDLPSDWPACVEVHRKLCGETDRSALGSARSYLSSTSRYQASAGSQAVRLSAFQDSVNKVKLKMRFTLSPTMRLRVMLDCLTALATLYDLLTTPFYLAWDLEATGTARTITYITAFYWTFDMFVSARTGFFKNGDLILEPWEVLVHYMKTWFIPDFMLVLIDWITLFIGDAQGLSLLRMYKMVKLARLLRLARLIQVLKRFMDRSTSDLVDTYLQIFQVVFSTLWSTHILACAWFAIGRLAPRGTGESWLDLRLQGDNDSFDEAEHVYQYASAFHWGMQMMTMGAMDVIPTNSTERFFSAFCLVFGLVFFSSMISMFNAKLMQIVVMKRERSSQISLVRQVLSRFKVSQTLAAVVQQQVTTRMKNKRTLTTSDVHAFDLLPLSLKMALQVEMCEPYLHTRVFIWLWARLDKTNYSKFCFAAVKFNVLTAGDTVFLAGATEVNVQIAMRGTLKYRPELLPSKFADPWEDVIPGTCMCEAALWCRWMTVGKAEAKTECEILAIVVEEFLSHVTRNRLMKNVAQEYGIANTFCLVSSTVDAFPDDLRMPNTEAIDIVMNCSHEVQVLFGLVAYDCHRSSWSHFPLLPDTYLQLRSEIEGGQCALATDERGEVVRGVCIGVLHLQNSCGEVLARIGEWDGTQVMVACELPGSKCQLGESAQDAVMRMIEEDLPTLREAIDILGTQDREEESSHSKKYRIRTRYMRVSIHAKLSDSFDEEGFEEQKLSFAIAPNVTSHDRVSHGTSTITSTSPVRKAVHMFASMGKDSTTTSMVSKSASVSAGRLSLATSSARGSKATSGMGHVRSTSVEFEDKDVFRIKSANGKDYLYTWMDSDNFSKFQRGAHRHSAIAKFLNQFHYVRSCESTDMSVWSPAASTGLEQVQQCDRPSCLRLDRPANHVSGGSDNTLPQSDNDAVQHGVGELGMNTMGLLVYL